MLKQRKHSLKRTQTVASYKKQQKLELKQINQNRIGVKCGNNRLKIVSKDSIKPIIINVSPQTPHIKVPKTTRVLANYISRSKIKMLKRIGLDIVEICNL